MQNKVIQIEHLAFEFRGHDEHNVAAMRDPSQPQYVPIGKQFTIAFSNCMENKRLYEDKLQKLEKYLSSLKVYPSSIHDVETFEESEELRSIIDEYCVLEAMVALYTTNPPFPHIFIDDAYSCLSKDRIPPLIHNYSSSLTTSEICLLSKRFKDKYSNFASVEPITFLYFEVNNDFQFCLATLDYLCRCNIPLNKCKYCGTYYIPIHRNMEFCSDQCRQNTRLLVERKCMSDPLRAAKKRFIDRLRLKNLLILTSDLFPIGDETTENTIRHALNTNNHKLLREIIYEEIDKRYSSINSEDELNKLIDLIDSLGRIKK